jgi:hypothetical protein
MIRTAATRIIGIIITLEKNMALLLLERERQALVPVDQEEAAE